MPRMQPVVLFLVDGMRPDALQRAAFFELACEIILLAGDRVRALPPEAVAALRRAASV